MAKSNAAKPQPGTDVAKAAPQSTAVVSTEVPDYLKDQQAGGGRGRENVGAEDLVIPRLEIVQDLSPARKKSDPNYIEGAEEGMLYNNVTRELYGTSVLVVPAMFVKEWLIWKDRKEGGGFRGAFANEAEAEAARAELEDGDKCEVVDTGQQFCVLVHPDGRVEEIVVSLAKSKAKISRKWNSLIRIANGDSFSRVYKLSVVEDQNQQNQKFFNFAVSPAGFPAEPIYRKAEAMYKAVTGGRARADRSVDDAGGEGKPGSGEY